MHAFSDARTASELNAGGDKTMHARRNATFTAAAAFAALLAAQTNLWAAPQAAPVDSRWLPWLGCWELVADAVDYREVESTGRRVVCVTPRPDGRGVGLTTYVDANVILEDTLLADGQQHAREIETCTGWQETKWSADGRRLFNRIELSCETGDQRSLAGLGMLAGDGRWIDLQSLSLDGGEHRELLVRHYKRLDDKESVELGYPALDAAVAIETATARAAASGPLDVEDVIEATGNVPPEVVEAAILESDSQFDLDRDALLRLADAEIADNVIDLMVAVSFPDEFIVDSGEKSRGGGYGGIAYLPYYGPIGYPGYGYSYCGSASYRYSSYWYSSCAFAPFGYGYAPYYRGAGRVTVSVKVPPTGSLYGGRVIKGRGFTKVSPRPKPANDGGFFGSSRTGRWARPRSGSGSVDAGSIGSSSGSSSGGGGGSVNRSGYRRGSSGRSAKPRGGSDEGKVKVNGKGNS